MKDAISLDRFIEQCERERKHNYKGYGEIFPCTAKVIVAKAEELFKTARWIANKISPEEYFLKVWINERFEFDEKESESDTLIPKYAYKNYKKVLEKIKEVRPDVRIPEYGELDEEAEKYKQLVITIDALDQYSKFDSWNKRVINQFIYFNFRGHLQNTGLIVLVDDNIKGKETRCLFSDEIIESRRGLYDEFELVKEYENIKLIRK